ncbi:Pentatricopeptide repeat-containing protein, partial [Durusdinium trenchii]
MAAAMAETSRPRPWRPWRWLLLAAVSSGRLFLGGFQLHSRSSERRSPYLRAQGHSDRVFADLFGDEDEPEDGSGATSRPTPDFRQSEGPRRLEEEDLQFDPAEWDDLEVDTEDEEEEEELPASEAELMEAVQVSDAEVDEFLAEFNAKPIVHKEPGTVPLDPFEKDASAELDTFKEIRSGQRMDLYGRGLAASQMVVTLRDRIRMLQDHEPLDALEELELLVKSCQEDLCQSVANARRALLACGGKICLDGGMGQVGGDEHPALKIPGIKIDERGDVPSVTWASVEKISAVEKTSQPSLTPWVDQELPLHSQDMEAFQRSHETSDYPFTSDTGDVPEAQAICNSIQSLRLPPQSPTSSSHGSNLPPMAPENTGRTTKDRRSSKSSTAHDPSSVHYMPSEMRVSGHMRREKLDTVIGIVVLLNSLTMAMELECEGQVAGERVGMPELLQCHHHISFYIAEHVFTIIFVL